MLPRLLEELEEYEFQKKVVNPLEKLFNVSIYMEDRSPLFVESLMITIRHNELPTRSYQVFSFEEIYRSRLPLFEMVVLCLHRTLEVFLRHSLNHIHSSATVLVKTGGAI